MKQHILTIAMAAACGLLFAGCADKHRDMPKTELPSRPASAALPCEEASDAEIMACIKDVSVKDICRKLDTTCARYKNLQSFVQRTWDGKDGK